MFPTNGNKCNRLQVVSKMCVSLPPKDSHSGGLWGGAAVPSPHGAAQRPPLQLHRWTLAAVCRPECYAACTPGMCCFSADTGTPSQWQVLIQVGQMTNAFFNRHTSLWSACHSHHYCVFCGCVASFPFFFTWKFCPILAPIWPSVLAEHTGFTNQELIPTAMVLYVKW